MFYYGYQILSRFQRDYLETYPSSLIKKGESVDKKRDFASFKSLPSPQKKRKTKGELKTGEASKYVYRSV